MTSIEWNQIIIGVIGSLAASGIAYLISRLSQLRPIPVPIWVVALLVALAIFYSYFEYQKRSWNFPAVYGKKFGVERVYLDGKHFVQCEFEGTELVMLGEKPFSMIRNTFKLPVTIKLEGKADITVNMLRFLYNDPVIRPSIESLIQNEIKKPR